MRYSTEKRLKRIGIAVVLAAAAVIAAWLYWPRAGGYDWYRLELIDPDVPPIPFLVGIPTSGDVGIVDHGKSSLSPRVVSRDPLTLRFPVFGTVIELEADDEDSVAGELRIPAQGGRVTVRGARIEEPTPAQRFPGTAPPSANLDGKWRLEIAAFGLGRAVFRQTDDVIEGSLIPPEIGDTRHLSGRVIGDRVQLSGFTGTTAILIDGTIVDGGRRIVGTWHYGGVNSWAFTAIRGDEPPLVDLVSARLKDGFTKVTIPELDQRFSGKPVIVNLFGTWCTACLDLTPELVRLHQRYHDKGLEILSIAVEPTGDDSAAMRRLQEFRERHGVSWSIDVRFTDDIVESFPPELERVLGFPVTIFVRRDGTVAGVHTSFISDAARPEHQEVIDRFDAWASEIVAPE